VDHEEVEFHSHVEVDKEKLIKVSPNETDKSVPRFSPSQ